MTVEEFFNAVPKADLAACLNTVAIQGRRSSLNDIEAHAKQLVKMLLKSEAPAQ